MYFPHIHMVTEDNYELVQSHEGPRKTERGTILLHGTPIFAKQVRHGPDYINKIVSGHIRYNLVEGVATIQMCIFVVTIMLKK